jgi:hypothetical protein
VVGDFELPAACIFSLLTSALRQAQTWTPFNQRRYYVGKYRPVRAWPPQPKNHVTNMLTP